MTINDFEHSAAALFDGGWRATDRDQLQEEYDLTDEEADTLADLLGTMDPHWILVTSDGGDQAEEDLGPVSQITREKVTDILKDRYFRHLANAEQEEIIDGQRELYAAVMTYTVDYGWITDRVPADQADYVNVLDLLVIVNGSAYDIDNIAGYMDDEIRERLNSEMAPCKPQEFFDAYCEAHYAKYGEPFDF